MSPRPTREQAVERILRLRADLLAALGTERVGLDRIDGRVLASAVVADRDVPPDSQATMDGFAVPAGADLPLSVAEGRSGPGDDPPSVDTGEAVRIATGGPLPAGTDAVVRREDATVEDGRLVAGEARAGQHVLARGSVVSAGETVLESGRRLAPRDAALLRELGHDGVRVRSRPSVALLATGTEIHEGREPDRDSETLANLVRAWGGRPTLAGSVPDDPERVGDRVAALAGAHDVVVTTGGTGVSAADGTTGALADRATVSVSGAAMRPGSGGTFAWFDAESAVVAALPGPPTAMTASATLLLRPLFVGGSRLSTVDARMARDLPVPDRDVEFVVPVEFADPAESPNPLASVGGTAAGTDGEPPEVVPFGHPDSAVHLYDGRYRPHRVSSCARLAAADGFVLARSDLAAGDTVAVVPYPVVES